MHYAKGQQDNLLISISKECVNNTVKPLKQTEAESSQRQQYQQYHINNINIQSTKRTSRKYHQKANRLNYCATR